MQGLADGIDFGAVPETAQKGCQSTFISNISSKCALTPFIPLFPDTLYSVHRVIGEANHYVQILNDRFTDPSSAS